MQDLIEVVGLISAARTRRINPIDGSFGVDGTLITRSIRPSSPEK